jgi:phosphatidylglycerol lysyltransferase
VQNAWIAFDVVLGLGLVALARRWRRPLATCLAIVITLDAIVTASEAIAWNASHMRSLVDFLPIVLAIAAPSIAAAVLWGARARRSWHEGVGTVD